MYLAFILFFIFSHLVLGAFVVAVVVFVAFVERKIKLFSGW